MIIRNTEVDGRRVDVQITDGQVTAVEHTIPRRPGDVVLDANGGALLPGLVDHHLHLHALATAGASAHCGPPAVQDPAALAVTLAAAPADRHGWVRGTSYHESVAGDLDAAGLDRLHPHRPVRIQHRSGALWIVNTPGAALLGLAGANHPGIETRPDGTPTGRLWRADPWLRNRLPQRDPPDLAAVGARLARYGITAVTDATPDLDAVAVDALAVAATSGALPQRVHTLGVPPGTAAPPGLTCGPYKIVIADSALPGLDDLIDLIGVAHTAGRAVAAHCVTREALVLLLAALDAAGGARPGDRIEHAALVPAELLADIARRGIRVVTQPGFLADRGDDYLRELPAADHLDLYRCRSALDAGVPLALSSDAPYGPLDPWAVLDAAVQRRTRSGTVAGPGERLDALTALTALLAPPSNPGGPPRRVQRGAAADLVLLDRPLTTALRAPRSDAVRAVLVDGRTIFEA